MLKLSYQNHFTFTLHARLRTIIMKRVDYRLLLIFDQRKTAHDMSG